MVKPLKAFPTPEYVKYIIVITALLGMVYLDNERCCRVENIT